MKYFHPARSLPRATRHSQGTVMGGRLRHVPVRDTHGGLAHSNKWQRPWRRGPGSIEPSEEDGASRVRRYEARRRGLARPRISRSIQICRALGSLAAERLTDQALEDLGEGGGCWCGEVQEGDRSMTGANGAACQAQSNRTTVAVVSFGRCEFIVNGQQLSASLFFASSHCRPPRTRDRPPPRAAGLACTARLVCPGTLACVAYPYTPRRPLAA